MQGWGRAPSSPKAARRPAGRAAAAGIDVDLSMNLPPSPIEADLEGRIMRGLAALQRDHGFSDFLSYQQAGGSAVDRGIAADWLRRRVRTVEADRLVISPGTQSALMALLLAVTKPGDVVLTDKLTYPGFKSAAAALGVRLVGVPADGEGMDPAALAEACRRHAPKAVYLLPTIHNPTTQTIGAGATRAARGGDPQARSRADRGRRLRKSRTEGAADRHADSRSAAISR